MRRLTVRADVKLEVGSFHAGRRGAGLRDFAADGRRQEQRHAAEQTGQRPAPGGQRNGPHAVRSCLPDAGRQEPRRRQRLQRRRRTGGCLRNFARRRLDEHQPRAVEELGRLELAFGRSHRPVHRGHQRIQGRVRPRGRRQHDLRLEVRHQPVPRRLPTSSFATTTSTPTTGSATGPAFRSRFTSRTISARRSAVRSGFRRSITARTRRSSSSPTRDSAIAPARTARTSPFPRRRCTTAISPSG